MLLVVAGYLQVSDKMQKLYKVILGVVVIVSMATACQKEAEVNPDRIGYHYAPLAIGDEKIFSVFTIQYSLEGADTLEFFEKEIVADTFLLQGGQNAYRIDRYISDNGTESWQPDSVFYAYQNRQQLVRMENNTRYLKLSFPVQTSKSWDGNRLNSLPEDLYYYQGLQQSYTIDAQEFENTITVIQADLNDSIVYRDLRKEIYAEGTGLIFSESIQLSYCTDIACLGQMEIENGEIRIKKMIYSSAAM